MEIRLYIDPDTGQPYIYGHGVTEDEVRQVILKVIYTRDPAGDSVFVITAFDLRGKPLKAYRRRRRRKPG